MAFIIFSYLDYYRLSAIARNAMLWALLGPPAYS
jgi:hypothetical protein